VDKGLSSVGAKLTLGEYLEKWLEDRSKNLRTSTFHDYKQYCIGDIIPAIGPVKLKDLRLPIVNSFYNQLLDSGRGEFTVRYIHRILHSALSDAIRLGYIGYNPADHATLPSKTSYRAMVEMKAKDYLAAGHVDDEVVPEEIHVLTESQVSQFIIAAMDSPYCALFDLAPITGMRAGELLGLMKNDIEYDNGFASIRIRRQVHRTPGVCLMFSPVKTKAGLRTIQIGANTSKILQEQLVRIELMKAIAGKRWQECGLLFPSSVGTPLEISNLRREFNRVLDKAGLPRIRFHDLRHTAASIMLSHKVPVVIVSKILGHSKPSVTTDIYYHFLPSSNDEATKLMDDLTPIAMEFSSISIVDEENEIE
jgi:integrase